MSWDWGTTVAGAVGIAGILGTYWGARHQGNVTVRLAREERTQTRLERSYLEVQRVVQRSALWAESAMPILGGPGQDLYPLLPSDDGQVLEASAQSVYWSPKVRELVHAWTAARNKLVMNVSLARTSAGYRDKAWQNVENLKKALRDAEDALVAQMSAELLAVEPFTRRHWRPRVVGRRHTTTPADATAPPVLDPHRAPAN